MKRKPLLLIAAVFILSHLHTAFAEVTFKWAPYLRLRHEYWRNIFDMDNSAKDNRNFFRVKTSLWGQLDIDDRASLFAKLTNENKSYAYFYQPSSRKKGYHYDINEVVVDNLYFDLKQVLDIPVDLRLGRQDLMGSYGENFIFADGTPLDGSRTYYFNAAKASWKIDRSNTLDFIFIVDNQTDDLLPVVNRIDGEQQLNSSDEKAYAIYYKSDLSEKLHWEDYYIYKIEASAGPTSSARLTRDGNRLSTLGTYVKYDFSPWTLRTQLAGQSGRSGNNDRQGVGGYIFLDRDFKQAAMSPTLSAGFIYLSGDNPKTSKVEAWDPLFSRFPWISELYVSAWTSETENSYWTNLGVYRTSLVLRPSRKMKLSFFYNFLRANELTGVSNMFSGGGKNRGHLYQARADYAFTKNISFYVLGEYLMTGNYYRDKQDGAVFLRTELQIKF